MILLDVMLPGKDGFGICRELRRSGLQTPIIFLTARTLEAHRVAGLNIGANDYVTKPSSPLELVARVRRLLQFVEHSRRDRRRLEDEGRAAIYIVRADLEQKLGSWQVAAPWLRSISL